MFDRLLSAPKEPEDVFTPRNPHVNKDMYIARPDLEDALRRALKGSLHILIHGESGSGKTWLYKQVLGREGVGYILANLANASRLGSIGQELANVVDRQEPAKKVGYTEGKSATANAGLMAGELTHEADFEIAQKEPLEMALAHVARVAGTGKGVLVLDNLEAVTPNDSVMGELADIVTLLDDERYAAYGVKLLIVGVPSGVRDYYSRVRNRATVSNRLLELSEVARLSRPQTRELVRKGFEDGLQFSVSGGTIEEIGDHVAWATDGVPQRIHEYCLQLAYLGVDHGRAISVGLTDTADARWLSSALSECYVAIREMMNERETKLGRRNQTLYVLGLIESDEFRWSEVEELVRREFPDSTRGKALNMSAMLTELATREDAIIRRSPKGDAYIFADPRFKMALRSMLRKSPQGDTVTRLELGK